MEEKLTLTQWTVLVMVALFMGSVFAAVDPAWEQSRAYAVAATEAEWSH